MADEVLELTREDLIKYIANNLRQMQQNDSNIIRQKINILKGWLIAEKNVSLKQFHDMATFNNQRFKDIKQGTYYKLKDYTLSKKRLSEIYKICNEIVQLLFSDENGLSAKKTLNYAIYYASKDKEGNITLHRHTTAEIPQALLRKSKPNAELRVRQSAAVLKEWEKDYQKLEVLQKIDNHLNNFFSVIKNTYKGTDSFPNSTISFGRITEAFERHLKNIHNITGDTDLSQVDFQGHDEIEAAHAWLLVKESIGKDAWYTGGDVGNTQVKAIITGDRGLTKYTTLEDLVNFFDYLLNVANTDIEEVAKETFNILTQQESGLDEKIMQKIQENAENMTMDILLNR